jgi:uncharacterized membrane protein (UPF0127 family)
MAHQHSTPDDGVHKFLSGAREKAPPGRLMNARTGQVIAQSAELAITSSTRRRGLLGRDRLEPGAALVIAPCNSIHMFFMRFAIDVVYVDRAGRVRKIVRALRPWRISAAMSAYAVIELAAGALDNCDIERGDRLYVENRTPSSS